MINRPSILIVGNVLNWVINTRNPDTQVLKDADSTPTVTVRKNGSSTSDTVTVTKRSATTGIYDCSYDPAGEIEGDSFQIRESIVMTGTVTAQATYQASFHVQVQAVMRGTNGALTTLGTNAPANWINAAAIATDAIAGAKVASDAVTKIQNGLATPTNITSASGIQLAANQDVRNVTGTLPDVTVSTSSVSTIRSGLSTLTASDVWSHATRSLTTFGTLVSDIWSAGSRTLTAISDSSGITTLLSRITGLLKTAAQADADKAEVIAAVEAANTTGPGSVLKELTITSAGQPADGVAVWITTDSAGTNTIAGTKPTNGQGKVQFMLDPGTYYAWCQKNGVDFTNPTPFTVDAP